MKKGFTLIEVIVVIGVTAIVVPLLVSIVLSIMRSEVKVLQLTQVKREGDSTLNVIRSLLKNSAYSLYRVNNFSFTPICTSPNTSYTSSDIQNPGSDFQIQDKYQKMFNFQLNNGVIASNSANIGATNDLTSDKVYVSSFSIRCNKTASYSPASVTVSFTICYPNGTQSIGPGDTGIGPNACTFSRSEEGAVLDYSTTVKLGSY